ncbi:Prepilin peptidase [Arthrobacter crystallopoietes BAB-32]|uniref:Prepilin peptidase n=1 Tax=Arthrobacter crystallopoietes BAB-32 TaxID=1246476 RepID=N1V202_9MICC|nr:prepilin peptidase [Arthrobacter crystallopoietes]EMY35350.1 Prepilin peptidase [Arthrobacter crystallopoietes BAB-32]
MIALLIAVCMCAGAAGAWLLFGAAQQESRTALPPGWRPLLAVLTAILSGLMAWWAGVSPMLPAFMYLAVMGSLLAAVDARHQLLPNRLVLPFLIGAFILLGLAAAASGAWTQLLAGLLGGAALFACYLLMALVKPGGIGMGDVKLASVVGLYAGYLGLNAWLLVLLGAFLLNTLAILALMLARVLKRNSDIPFGPAMIAAALLAPLAA